MKCQCRPKQEWRAQPEWEFAKSFLYGYGVEVEVIAHTGPCQLTDEVLRVRVIKVCDAP